MEIFKIFLLAFGKNNIFNYISECKLIKCIVEEGFEHADISVKVKA